MPSASEPALAAPGVTPVRLLKRYNCRAYITSSRSKTRLWYIFHQIFCHKITGNTGANTGTPTKLVTVATFKKKDFCFDLGFLLSSEK